MKMEFRDIPLPGELDRIVEDSLKQVVMEQKKKILKSRVFKGGTLAAVFVCGVILYISNPSFAADLPLIGHIFEKMQDDFPYSGDYSGIGEPLADESDFETQDTGKADKSEETSGYTKTADGVTVTLSEIYCNTQALYITVQIQSKEEFSKFSGFTCDVSGKVDFLSDNLVLKPTLDGGFINENTFAGLLRFDLNQITGYRSQIEIPEVFSFAFCMERLLGSRSDIEPPDLGVTKEEIDNMSDEEWKTFMQEWDRKHPDYYKNEYVEYNGPWEFDLEVALNKSNMQVVEINEKNEQGIGFSRVIKDRFEITMYDYAGNAGEIGNDYFPVMLDADGNLMDGNDGWVNTIEIGSHDISTVDIFLIDEILWLDKLKGIYWNNPGADTYDGKTFKEILLEHCAYHKEISFKE